MARLIPLVEQDLEPTDEEVEEYAEFLGVDLEFERDLLPTAKRLLTQSLPTPWKAYMEEGDDDYFYFNSVTGESTWDHPLDGSHKKDIETAREMRRHYVVTLAAREQGQHVLVTATSMAGEVLATVESEASDGFDGFEDELLKLVKVEEGVIVSLMLPGGTRIGFSARSKHVKEVLL